MAADILWYNANTGETQIWFMDDHKCAGRATVVGEDGNAVFIGPPFSIVAAGDFNRNGSTDILWHNAETGETQIWFMDDHKCAGRATVIGEDGNPAFVGLPWSIVAAGDFNRNGSTDILWYNVSTGETQIWFMDVHRVTGRATVVGEDGNAVFIGPPFSIVAAGDFNRNGNADILWHNAETGETQIWFMDDHKCTGRATVIGEDGNPAFVGLPWSIVAAGDFNRNGSTDILWHNANTNETQIWFMDDHRVTGRATVVGEDGNAVFIGPPFSIVAAGDFDFLVRANAVIRNHYRRTGGSLGPLGEPDGALVRGGGIARQEYLLGNIVVDVAELIPAAETYYDAEVKLAAVKCFGTEDPGGTDETYVVISLIAINPNSAGSDELVQTVRTEIDNNVEGGKVFFKSRTIGQLRAFPGGGIKIHLAIFEHENGDANQLRDDIHAVLKDAARKGAQLIAGAAAGGDQRLAGVAGDVMEFEVGGVKPFDLLTLGLSNLLANALSDDLIGEHEFVIPPRNIVDIVDQAPFEASFRRHPESLGSDVQFNWPRTDADEVLISGGGGSYKVYFTITPIKVTRPVPPGIP